jgi:hypothetical protein
MNLSLYGDTITYQEGVNGYLSNVVTLNQASPDTNGANGTSNYIGHSGTVPGPTAFRSLEAFPLTGIPAGSTINSVTLTLTIRGNPVSNVLNNTYTYNLHELVGSATEAGATWNNRDTTGPVAWTTPGGDYFPTVLSSFDANPSVQVAGNTFVFSSSAAFVAAAQAALDGSGTLYMLAIAPVSEVASGETRINFASDDFATVAFRPLLTVDYTPIPEPSAILLFGVGIVGLAGYVRHKRK